MPVISFTSDHRVKSVTDYPTMKLETGQRALVLMFEREPVLEFVHTLNKPELGPDNRAIYETTTQWGKEVSKPRMNFVGKSICLGDPDKLMEVGVDPEGCPVCAESKRSDVVQKPARRFAAHVGRYAIKPNGFQISEPFAVSIEAWVFSEKVFNNLVDIAEEWGDLREHDLKLGPCESKQYQKFDIAVSARAEWLESEERQKIMAEAYNNNKTPDLSALIARRNTRAQVEEDLDDVKRQSAIAFGRAEPDTPDVSTVSSDLDLDGLLGNSQPTPEQPAKAQQTDEAQQSVKAPEKEKTANATPDLDSLLKSF